MRRDVREEREVQEQSNNKVEDQPCYCTFTGKKCWSQSLTVEEHPWEFSKQSPK